MNKRFLKKVVALAMTATLVVGNGTIALAADATTTTGQSQNITGGGASEGHVDEHVTKLTLPTLGGTEFAYKADPERLVERANNGVSNYDVDTLAYGVYFTSGTAKTYQSVQPKIINKSTSAVKVTVAAKFTSSGAHDIPIGTEMPSKFVSGTSTKGKASLYMGLKVGSEAAKALKLNEEVKTTVDVEGKADNFELTYNSGTSKYEFGEKAGATGWNEVGFGFEGGCTYADASDGTDEYTAPTINVTYSWVDTGAKEASLQLIKNQNNGNLVHVFESDAPTGEITALTINGINRLGQYTNGNVSYADGRFIVKAACVTSFSLEEGATTIVATIDGKEYTFVY